MVDGRTRGGAAELFLVCVVLGALLAIALDEASGVTLGAGALASALALGESATEAAAVGAGALAEGRRERDGFGHTFMLAQGKADLS